MDKKLNFSAQELLDYKFGNVPQGYDPDEVDRILDKIIEDYEKMENVSPSVDLEKISAELEQLRRTNRELESELVKEKNKWKYVSRDHKDIHIDNYELLQRIGKLEMYIHEHMNINPDDIK